ncbi:hypothetical protein ACFWP7_04975 [Streptomyces sp. NPDC058470]|uniref:hypothetical protein n=1 Tax=Streptomyces sp. NPDC058470 TaxID=3346515 RepID=UPI003660AF38
MTELTSLTSPGQALVMLDPSLDLWSEHEGDVTTAVPSLGRRAWSLAAMCGLEDVVLSVDDVEALTGLTKRGAQALLKRMAEANCLLVQKVRQGRSFVYEIYWGSCFRKDGEWFDNCYDRHLIRNARAARDQEIQAASARRGTPAGFLAYRLSTANPKREAYLEANPLPADADGVWRAWWKPGTRWLCTSTCGPRRRRPDRSRAPRRPWSPRLPRPTR